MFITYNYLQIRCKECDVVSHFECGKEYKSIECPICNPVKKLKEKTNGKSRKVSTKNTKEV